MALGAGAAWAARDEPPAPWNAGRSPPSAEFAIGARRAVRSDLRRLIVRQVRLPVAASPWSIATKSALGADDPDRLELPLEVPGATLKCAPVARQSRHQTGGSQRTQAEKASA